MRKLGHVESTNFERHEMQPHCYRCAATGIRLVKINLPGLETRDFCEHCAEVTVRYNQTQG